MKIASYYQKMLETSLIAARGMEPITFAGMFDCGVDYLFSLSIPLFEAELEKCTVVFFDLSGLSKKEEIESELRFALSEKIPEISPSAGFDELTRYVRNSMKEQAILLVLYLGQDGKMDRGLFQFLNRTRNLLGWRFSYCIFTTSRLLQAYEDDALIEKVLKRNIVPVLPLTSTDADVVLHNYEERYGKNVSHVVRERIYDLSGGNPGLIKALYLQTTANPTWKEPDILEEQLYFRLKGIVEDLPDDVLKQIFNTKDHRLSPLYEYFLTRYGYIQKDKKRIDIFTSLLSDFWPVYKTQMPKVEKSSVLTDPLLLHLSKSQRKVLEYLKSRSGELVSKDDIAKVLWGDDWADRYSDWAIDQLISTLRDRLSKIHDTGKIVTKRGEGIIYIPEK